MKRVKQLEFKGKGLERPDASFGGSLLKGNPKGKRPLSSKLPVMITLRATKGGMRKPQAFGKVASYINRAAKKHGVRVYRYANVGNHLHILVRIPRLASWSAFIREVTGQIAQFMHRGKGFWMFRPHTRIVQGWKKAFTIAKDYIYLNNLEAEGWIKRRETRNLKDLRAIFSD